MKAMRKFKFLTLATLVTAFGALVSCSNKDSSSQTPAPAGAAANSGGVDGSGGDLPSLSYKDFEDFINNDLRFHVRDLAARMIKYEKLPGGGSSNGRTVSPVTHLFRDLVTDPNKFIEPVKFFANSGFCESNEGNEVHTKDASIDKKGNICISFRPYRNMSSIMAFRKILSLSLHEISHYYGYNEEQAIEIQESIDMPGAYDEFNVYLLEHNLTFQDSLIRLSNILDLLSFAFDDLIKIVDKTYDDPDNILHGEICPSLFQAYLLNGGNKGSYIDTSTPETKRYRRYLRLFLNHDYTSVNTNFYDFDDLIRDCGSADPINTFKMLGKVLDNFFNATISLAQYSNYFCLGDYCPTGYIGANINQTARAQKIWSAVRNDIENSDLAINSIPVRGLTCNIKDFNTSEQFNIAVEKSEKITNPKIVDMGINSVQFNSDNLGLFRVTFGLNKFYNFLENYPFESSKGSSMSVEGYLNPHSLKSLEIKLFHLDNSQVYSHSHTWGVFDKTDTFKPKFVDYAWDLTSCSAINGCTLTAAPKILNEIEISCSLETATPENDKE